MTISRPQFICCSNCNKKTRHYEQERPPRPRKRSEIQDEVLKRVIQTLDQLQIIKDSNQEECLLELNIKDLDLNNTEISWLLYDVWPIDKKYHRMFCGCCFMTGKGLETVKEVFDHVKHKVLIYL